MCSLWFVGYQLSLAVTTMRNPPKPNYRRPLNFSIKKMIRPQPPPPPPMSMNFSLVCHFHEHTITNHQTVYVYFSPMSHISLSLRMQIIVCEHILLASIAIRMARWMCARLVRAYLGRWESHNSAFIAYHLIIFFQVWFFARLLQHTRTCVNIFFLSPFITRNIYDFLIFNTMVGIV